jgi:hypothetical protein
VGGWDDGTGRGFEMECNGMGTQEAAENGMDEYRGV